MAAKISSLHFALKVVSRCNLSCRYCYVYNKADHSWQDRPFVMSDTVFEAALDRIRSHCLRSQQRSVRIVFHGGEPCLSGVERFSNWCRRIREKLQDLVRVHLSVQTNGTLLDQRWAEVFKQHDVIVGISMDGPKELHDRFRVDHQGEGSYNRVKAGITQLRQTGIPVQFLSVIQLGSNPLQIHRHLIELGASSIDYLFPDFTHDTIAPIRAQHGSTPCADYLIPIFEEWWFKGTLDVPVSLFWNMARVILGGESQVDFLGNRPFGFLFVETDGAIEGLDVLRVCKHGIAQTGLNVLRDEFSHVAEVSELHGKAIFTGLSLPAGCQQCPERETCAGGYLPHRYSEQRKFDNPSVWCQDLLRLFNHIRARLDVSVEETALRRQILNELTDEANQRLVGLY